MRVPGERPPCARRQPLAPSHPEPNEARLREPRTQALAGPNQAEAGDYARILATEIERKFLVPRRPPELEQFRSEEVEQGYLAADLESEVRVRRIGEQGVLTVKRGSGRNRLEEEIEITEEQFQALWPATKGRRIKKRRHLVPLDGLTAEVDVYSGALADLITAEVEFDSIQESEAFDPPAWFGDELTDDPRWSNQTLALHGRPSETA